MIDPSLDPRLTADQHGQLPHMGGICPANTYLHFAFCMVHMQPGGGPAGLSVRRDTYIYAWMDGCLYVYGGVVLGRAVWFRANQVGGADTTGWMTLVFLSITMLCYYTL